MGSRGGCGRANARSASAMIGPLIGAARRRTNTRGEAMSHSRLKLALWSLPVAVLAGAGGARATTGFLGGVDQDAQGCGQCPLPRGLRAATSALLIGDDGVLMIDDQFAPLSEKLTAAIRALSNKPIRMLINTHVHGDHTGGNENFGKMGIDIVAHDNVRVQARARRQRRCAVARGCAARRHVRRHDDAAFERRDHPDRQTAARTHRRRQLHPLRERRRHPCRRRVPHDRLPRRRLQQRR